jgi:hypothetical protein
VSRGASPPKTPRERVFVARPRGFEPLTFSPGARKVFIVGRLRYETITFIDWAPDPGSGSPRFYVEYNWRHAPYADFVLYEESGYEDHLYPLEDIQYVGNRRLKRLMWRS